MHFLGIQNFVGASTECGRVANPSGRNLMDLATDVLEVDNQHGRERDLLGYNLVT